MENQFIVPLMLVRLVVVVVDVGYVCDKGVGFVTNKLNEMTG